MENAGRAAFKQGWQKCIEFLETYTKQYPLEPIWAVIDAAKHQNIGLPTHEPPNQTFGPKNPDFSPQGCYR